MNQVFQADDQTTLKLRQKFQSKKALHWFLIHKAVSAALIVTLIILTP